MNNNKSPGFDAFAVELYKLFLVDIGHYILRSLNYGYRIESLSVTQIQGVITCVPKPNIFRMNLKNWRPDLLLNVL